MVIWPCIKDPCGGGPPPVVHTALSWPVVHVFVANGWHVPRQKKLVAKGLSQAKKFCSKPMSQTSSVFSSFLHSHMWISIEGYTGILGSLSYIYIIYWGLGFKVTYGPYKGPPEGCCVIFRNFYMRVP